MYDIFHVAGMRQRPPVLFEAVTLPSLDGDQSLLIAARGPHLHCYMFTESGLATVAKADLQLDHSAMASCRDRVAVAHYGRVNMFRISTIASVSLEMEGSWSVEGEVLNITWISDTKIMVVTKTSVTCSLCSDISSTLQPRTDFEISANDEEIQSAVFHRGQVYILTNNGDLLTVEISPGLQTSLDVTAKIDTAASSILSTRLATQDSFIILKQGELFRASDINAEYEKVTIAD